MAYTEAERLKRHERYIRNREKIKSQSREYYLKNIEKYREKHNEYYQRNVEAMRVNHMSWARSNRKRMRKISKKYYLKNPEKCHARRALASAVKRGAVVRPKTCSRCGRIGKIQGHHHRGYSFPLDVLWVCVPCHVLLDGRANFLAAESALHPR